ncbi:MAG: hypothetical protein PHN57_05660 [Candidatus Omnitrophica bacterium]|nr:hypothetical protein [Candidatus Omnitrophota bacterium]
MRTAKYLIITAVVLLFSTCALALEEQVKENTLLFFFSPSCNECIKVRSGLMAGIEVKYKGRITVEYRDITDLSNYKFLLGLKDQYGPPANNSLPVIFFKNRFLSGEAQIQENLDNLLSAAYEKQSLPAGKAKHADLISLFLSFTPLAVIGAGLVDGINPCAFTVIVFFISFLALQGYKKSELVIVGIFFIFAVFCAYLLIGLGLFNFLYRIEGFWFVKKIINFSIGIFSLIVGALAVFDIYKYKKSKSTDNQTLQLPKAVKDQIHRLIGLHYRKQKGQEQDTKKLHISRLILSAFVTGFLVSILEAICTGQMYLPTITLVLKATHLKMQAFMYLVVYNLMFIVPLIGVFLLALFGATSEQMTKVFKSNFMLVKTLMAVVFFGLGIFLTWRA